MNTKYTNPMLQTKHCSNGNTISMRLHRHDKTKSLLISKLKIVVAILLLSIIIICATETINLVADYYTHKPLYADATIITADYYNNDVDDNNTTILA